LSVTFPAAFLTLPLAFWTAFLALSVKLMSLPFCWLGSSGRAG
jgi:hypothetical protein